jgi:hypothetical protein
MWRRAWDVAQHIVIALALAAISIFVLAVLYLRQHGR